MQMYDTRKMRCFEFYGTSSRKVMLRWREHLFFLMRQLTTKVKKNKKNKMLELKMKRFETC